MVAFQVIVLTFQLLANEIRREQNTLLQCIRYIVRSEFFGAGAMERVEGGEREDQGEEGVGDQVPNLTVTTSSNSAMETADL